MLPKQMFTDASSSALEQTRTTPQHTVEYICKPKQTANNVQARNG